jgi:hypothetical protein
MVLCYNRMFPRRSTAEKASMRAAAVQVQRQRC